MSLRLPPGFSDQKALQDAYTLFRLNGICAASLLAGSLMIGTVMHITKAQTDARIRYAIIIGLSLAWAMGMLGGTFMVEARRLQLWIREREQHDFGKIVAVNVAIFFCIAAMNLIAGSLAGICVISWLTIRSGFMI